MEAVIVSKNKYYVIHPAVIVEKSYRKENRFISLVKKIWRIFMDEFFALDIVEKL